MYATLLPSGPFHWRVFWIIVWSSLTYITLAVFKTLVILLLRFLATWYVNLRLKTKQHVDWISRLSSIWVQISFATHQFCQKDFTETLLWTYMWMSSKFELKILNNFLYVYSWGKVSQKCEYLLYCYTGTGINSTDEPFGVRYAMCQRRTTKGNSKNYF